MSEETHYGYDQSFTFTTLHKGTQENCPAPECIDRSTEGKFPDGWGIWCAHGKHLIVPDPASEDLRYPDGIPAEPWPCAEPGCSLADLEREAEETFHDSLPGYYERHGD